MKHRQTGDVMAVKVWTLDWDSFYLLVCIVVKKIISKAMHGKKTWKNLLQFLAYCMALKLMPVLHHINFTTSQLCLYLA